MMKSQQVMSEQNESLVYGFTGFRVDVARRQLLREGVPVPLTSRAFDTLLILIRHRGTTVSKSELMNSIWADTAVEENNLTQQISALRRALGERPDDHRFIVTVPGRGYCFVADIHPDSSGRKATDLVHTETTAAYVATWLAGFDPSALRGYVCAITLIALVAFGFAISAIRDSGFNRPQRLAVLNFKVSSSGDEFIGNGISDTLRARLGSVQDLTVRPGDAVLADQDALAVGRRLQVDTVVTGSVQRDQNRIRVAVEMLDVAGGRIVWGKTFDDSASNLFALQDSIAGEVARVLNIDLTSHRGSGHRTTELPTALTEVVGILSRRPQTISV
jgi:DNA-binding winged helix-turn-helix (wHTH) protein/TolB-like protein